MARPTRIREALSPTSVVGVTAAQNPTRNEQAGPEAPGTLAEAVGQYRPELIVSLPCCCSGIIGDDF